MPKRLDAASLGGACLRRIDSLHRDERGSMSIVSVFALVLIVMLLGMVINSARQIDHKVKLQNAADSATYAGGIVLTRSMNTLAFTNHLLADVFALTAYMREARDRTAESMTPQILDNWERVAPAFIGSPFGPFDQLGYAIEEKVPREREMVFRYGEWAAAASELMLPVLEEILAEELIPEFQRALTVATPVLAQYAADEVASRHGREWPRPATVRGVMWRTAADPVGGFTEQLRRTLPVVDPVLDMAPNQDEYLRDAQSQRSDLAYRYLDDWNNETLEVFDVYGKFSQYSNLWRVFTCGHLEKLLNVEYPDTNLPFQIRTKLEEVTNTNAHVELDFMFVGVVYRERLGDQIPRVFRNPVASDSLAFSQVEMFVPQRRLVLWEPGARPRSGGSIGGVPGERLDLPGPLPAPTSGSPQPATTVRQSNRFYPEHWDLLNQNWTMQLVPATSSSIREILRLQPYVNGMPAFDLPDLRNLNDVDMQWLNHH